jgi:error-prone DNA polymerase
VIVRQRPGSAKGMCFLTLEDETGTANAVLTPPRYRRFRVVLHTAPLVEIEGPVQNVDGVVHVRVERLVPLDVAAASTSSVVPPAKAWDAFAGEPKLDWGALPDSHDYR